MNTFEFTDDDLVYFTNDELVERFQRKALDILLSRCTKEQVGKFNQIFHYPGVSQINIPPSKLKSAIEICQRTLRTTNAKWKEVDFR